jgi:hypothetical protein
VLTEITTPVASGKCDRKSVLRFLYIIVWEEWGTLLYSLSDEISGE